MYAQLTRMRVPIGQMDVLRCMIEDDYLPVVRTRPGFVAAYLLEHVDDADAAEMIQFWDTHASAESFARTGLLASSIQSLAARLHGLQIQRQGYIVRTAISELPLREDVISLS
jgi:hypothetical protein